MPSARADDAELLRQLVGEAARLSDRTPPPVDEPSPPRLRRLAAEAFADRICPAAPDTCRHVQAAYDTQRREILIRDTADLGDAMVRSFLVHEGVHWLQHRERGFANDVGCRAVIAAEREAYAVQRRYLESRVSMIRLPRQLPGLLCPPQSPD